MEAKNDKAKAIMNMMGGMQKAAPVSAPAMPEAPAENVLTVNQADFKELEGAAVGDTVSIPMSVVEVGEDGSIVLEPAAPDQSAPAPVVKQQAA